MPQAKLNQIVVGKVSYDYKTVKALRDATIELRGDMTREGREIDVEVLTHNSVLLGYLMRQMEPGESQ